MADATIKSSRQSIYADVTARLIHELEQGRLPWVQPWDTGSGYGMPHNAITGRAFSGINILILWAAVNDCHYPSQAWLTYRQAQATGGTIRRGEKGTTVCYADHFTPKDEEARAQDEGRDARQLAFLKRFTVFNVAQCEGLPEAPISVPRPTPEASLLPCVKDLIRASRADVRIGGEQAFYSPAADIIAVPARAAFRNPVDWYRTLLHEFGHWTGHHSRLNRKQNGRFGSSDYAREELIAEIASAFTCATLSIQPTVRHADYVGAWLEVLREDERAIFRAASQASKAADYLLQYVGTEELSL